MATLMLVHMVGLKLVLTVVSMLLRPSAGGDVGDVVYGDPDEEEDIYGGTAELFDQSKIEQMVRVGFKPDICVLLRA